MRFACPSFDGAVHAIAFYVFPSSQSGRRQLNPTVDVFDPNYGEFSMPYGVFLVWLPTFSSEKYGALFSDAADKSTLATLTPNDSAFVELFEELVDLRFEIR